VEGKVAVSSIDFANSRQGPGPGGNYEQLKLLWGTFEIWRRKPISSRKIHRTNRSMNTFHRRSRNCETSARVYGAVFLFDEYEERI
jgi:hypothetical protein